MFFKTQPLFFCLIVWDSFAIMLYMKGKKFTFNWPLAGNSHIIDFLSKSIENDNVSGSYIFCGPDDIGKFTIANYFTKSLVCRQLSAKAGSLPCGQCSPCVQLEKGLHGDVHIIKKQEDKKNISIEQVREFIRILNMASFMDSYKIGIIKNAESLSIEAANALLKTLEESKAKVVVILTVTDTSALPKTIVSRSQILKFNPVSADIIYDYLINEHGAGRSAAKNLSHLCLGRPALAVKFLRDKEFLNNYLEQAKSFLRLARNDINSRLSVVESLIGPRPSGQESASLAGGIIEIWEGIARDLLLLEFGQKNLIQHAVIMDDLEVIKKDFEISDLINLAKNLKQAKEYLRFNVNPKLVLENVVVGMD